MFAKYLRQRATTYLTKKNLSTTQKPKFVESFVFPREKEGNIYSVNWSLTEDGVTPVGNAYRNPRVSLVTKRLGIKQNDSKLINLESPVINGTYKVLEAGDTISHSDFKDFKDVQKKFLSSGVDLFVEDASLGALSDIRVGVRIISDNPSLSLIFRNLLIPTPPAEVDHRARFNGWNLDERWKSEDVTWDEISKQYNIENIASKPRKGQRPIVAFVGCVGDFAAVQFVEADSKVVGSNIVIGDKTPIRAIIEAIGIVADALINENDTEGISIPSHIIVYNNRSYIVINGDDEFVKSVANKNILYGAYNNYISSFGISALWNGYITSNHSNLNSSSSSLSVSPIVSIKNDYIISNPPDNLINPASEIIFIDKATTSGTITKDEIVKRLNAITGPSKAEIINGLVNNLKGTVVSSTKEALNLFS